MILRTVLHRAHTLTLAMVLASSAQAEEANLFDPETFSKADVVIIGEVHDNPVRHLNQAAVIALAAPKAVVFEMLTDDMARLVTPDTANDPSLGATLDWEASGWPDFAIYAPIFASLGDAVTIGAAPDEAVRAAAREAGVATVFGADAARFGLDQPLPLAQQEAREALMQANHCGALPPGLLPTFVAMQRFTDASFARATLDALETYGAPVVVITGNGHARTDWGMPVYLNAAAPNVAVTSVGQLTQANPDAPYDLVQITPPAPSDGGDPCAAFK